jgi:hypothetical protein
VIEGVTHVVVAIVALLSLSVQAWAGQPAAGGPTSGPKAAQREPGSNGLADAGLTTGAIDLSNPPLPPPLPGVPDLGSTTGAIDLSNPPLPPPPPVAAEDDPDHWKLTHSERLFVFGLAQVPSDSKLNVNNVLGLSRTESDIQLSSDLTYKNEKNQLILKPRLLIQRGWAFDGIHDGDTVDLVLPFAQELRYQRKVSSTLFASYGAENLVWGPSQLVSCSNPFLTQNGRLLSDVVLPALDYGRLIWIPDSTWSASLIVNTAQGLMRTYGDFKKVYAAKVDWTGDKKSASVIVSHSERGTNELGFFGILNISDPFLIYMEGRVKGGEGHVHVQDGGRPDAGDLQRQAGNRPDPGEPHVALADPRGDLLAVEAEHVGADGAVQHGNEVPQVQLHAPDGSSPRHQWHTRHVGRPLQPGQLPGDHGGHCLERR